MTAFAFDVAMAALGVNRPEDVVHQRDAINWRLHEDNVRRLRGRIFKATKDGDWPTVRNPHLNRPRGLLEPCAATSGKHGS